MYARLGGSSHTAVPVKPVWPTEPAGKKGAIVRENGDETSQPSVRVLRPSSARSHMRATVAGSSTRWPSRLPPRRSIRQIRATSAAVENMPAWPATPPSVRARGSCTSPVSKWPLAHSVGAIRACAVTGGRNDVSESPSGRNTRRSR